MAKKNDRNAPTVRAFSVLDVLASNDRPVSLAELASQVRLPKPSVHRLLAQLGSVDLVRREPGGKRFAVGPRLSRLALHVLMNSTTRGTRHAILQRLVDELGETCNLTMLDGAEVVYLDRVEAAWPLRISLQPGSRVPLHCTASGKLLLALQPAAKRTRLLDRIALTRHTPHTLTERAPLEEELKRIRQRKVSTDNEEYLAGLVCVAVPITAPDGKAFAAVAVQALLARMPLERALGEVRRLKSAAAALASTFD